jgi:hypothetical protein
MLIRNREIYREASTLKNQSEGLKPNDKTKKRLSKKAIGARPLAPIFVKPLNPTTPWNITQRG